MGRRRDAPAACSRGGGSPACDVSGVPELRSAWDLVVDVSRGMRKALEATGRWVRDWVRPAAEQGRPGGRRLAGVVYFRDSEMGFGRYWVRAPA